MDGWNYFSYADAQAQQNLLSRKCHFIVENVCRNESVKTAFVRRILWYAAYQNKRLNNFAK